MHRVLHGATVRTCEGEIMGETFDPPGPGPWQRDEAHVPHGWSPLIAEIYPEGAMRGFAETFARWGCLFDVLAWGLVNGFPYQQPVPFDVPGPDGPPSDEFIGSEIGRRTAVAAAPRSRPRCSKQFSNSGTPR